MAILIVVQHLCSVHGNFNCSTTLVTAARGEFSLPRWPIDDGDDCAMREWCTFFFKKKNFLFSFIVSFLELSKIAEL